MALNCNLPPGSRRRLFWATQPDACGVALNCGAECGAPGLAYSVNRNRCGAGCSCCPPATDDPSCPPPDVVTDRSISTEGWLRGLIINMLMTDARQVDTVCGYRPGSQGGHWSESYIQGGAAGVGTLMRTVPATGRVQGGINLVTAFAQATLQKLVDRGVALGVNVTSSYLGGGRMMLDVVVQGRVDGEARVGLTGSRMANGWVWN